MEIIRGYTEFGETVALTNLFSLLKQHLPRDQFLKEEIVKV